MFFSGFSLHKEKELFKDYIIDNDFTISGFSYGAIKTIEYALNTDARIDKIQLFSPAYFNNKDFNYKRMQLLYFKKDCYIYCDKFLRNCNLNDKQIEKYFKIGTYEELKDLLFYNWSKNKMAKIKNKGIHIEVYIGTSDNIVDSQKAIDFFRYFAEVYVLSGKSHIL